MTSIHLSLADIERTLDDYDRLLRLRRCSPIEAAVRLRDALDGLSPSGAPPVPPQPVPPPDRIEPGVPTMDMAEITITISGRSGPSAFRSRRPRIARLR